MKNFLRRLGTNSLKPVIVGAVLFSVKSFGADEIYNFYFQKAPGPVTVIQGGGENKLAEQTVPAALSVKDQPVEPTVVAKNSEVNTEEYAFRKWSLHFGTASNVDFWGKGRGQALGVHYNPSRKLGFEAEIIRTRPSITPSYGYGEMDFFDFNAGISLTLFDFRISPIGIRIPLLVGALTSRKYGYDCWDDGMGWGQTYCYGTNHAFKERDILPYIGIGFEAVLTERLSIIANWKMAGRDLDQFTDGLNGGFFQQNWTGTSTAALNYYF